MRHRLVAAFIGLSVLAVALYAVPRSFVLVDLIRGQEQQRVDDTVSLTAHVIDERQTPLTTSFLDAIKGDHEWIQVRRGTALIGSTGAQRPYRGSDLTATRPLAAGGSVTVGLSEPVVTAAIRDALVPLVVLGLSIVVLAGLTGYLLGRLFARPLQELAAAAEGLGNGDLDPQLPRYRIRELRAIGTALTSSGARIKAMLDHERKVAVHASHELRTPIAALRLELEDLAHWRETSPPVAEQLQRVTGEVDRLSAAVGDLLDLAREGRAHHETDVRLQTLIAGAVGHPNLGSRVVQRRIGRVSIRVDAAAATRIIQELAQTVLADGATQVVISVVRHDTRVEISFQPSGKGASPDAPPDTAELASTIGGRISRRGLGLVLHLPLHQQVSALAGD